MSEAFSVEPVASALLGFDHTIADIANDSRIYICLLAFD